jgi:hypothetical protein
MSEVRVFPCPRCREFIATDAKSCRFCSVPIDPRAAELAADAQDEENRRYMRRRYARHMLTGAGLFALGVAVTVITFSAAATSVGGGYFMIGNTFRPPRRGASACVSPARNAGPA